MNITSYLSRKLRHSISLFSSTPNIHSNIFSSRKFVHESLSLALSILECERWLTT
ncbi:hypothetical protein Sjap_026539 [Stephania japonica]|uniref:Uncharacterized protein n=1 Tax=Stephania japonica TaxID=461633 RepID=A0AAP0HF47_9MAGN